MTRAKDNQLLHSLGSSVLKRRLELGLSQEDLAERASLHRTYISDVERGLRNITVLTLESIAQALDVPIMVLLYPQPADVREKTDSK